MEVFNRKLALEMVGEEEDLLRELENAFVYDKKFQISHLEDLENSGQLKEAADYVHYFKGAARQLAAEKAAFAGQALEDVLRGKKEGSIKDLNGSFMTALFESIEVIKKDID